MGVVVVVVVEVIVNDCVGSKHWSSVIWSSGTNSETSSEHPGLEVRPTRTQVFADDVHWILMYTATSRASPAMWD